MINIDHQLASVAVSDHKANKYYEITGNKLSIVQPLESPINSLVSLLVSVGIDTSVAKQNTNTISDGKGGRIYL